MSSPFFGDTLAIYQQLATPQKIEQVESDCNTELFSYPILGVYIYNIYIYLFGQQGLVFLS